MPRRAASPAASEHEVDILGSIFANDNDIEVKTKAKKRTGGHDEIDLDIDALLNGAGDGGEDDDEALIALQQAASFRKTTNLKGKTGKKSGGFQAMGKKLLSYSLQQKGWQSLLLGRFVTDQHL